MELTLGIRVQREVKVSGFFSKHCTFHHQGAWVCGLYIWVWGSTSWFDGGVGFQTSVGAVAAVLAPAAGKE